MKFTFFATTGAILALASTPAFAQLAGSGNLVSTAASPPSGASSPHQSTTMVNGAAGSRVVLAGVNGGDAAPGVKTSKMVVLPGQARSATPAKTVGGWVEVGAAKGSVTQAPTVRAHVDNGLGTGPGSTYRGVTVNVPTSASALGGTGAGAAGKSGSGALASNLTSAVPK